MFEYRPLLLRLNFALIATSILIVLTGANFLATLWELYVYQRYLDGADSYENYIAANDIGGTIAIILLVALFVSYVSNSMWIFRASWLVRHIMDLRPTKAHG